MIADRNRNPQGMHGIGGKVGKVGRQRRKENHGRAAGRSVLGRYGRGGRRPHVGGKERPRCAGHRWEKAEARLSSNEIWRICAPPAKKDGVVAKSEGRFAKGLATGDSLKRRTSFRFLAPATLEPLSDTVLQADLLCNLDGTPLVSRGQRKAATRPGCGRQSDRQQPRSAAVLGAASSA